MMDPRPTRANQRRPRTRERGLALEYALLLALIGGGIVGAVALVADSTKRVYSRTSSAITLDPASNAGAPMTMQTPPESGRTGGSSGPPAASGDPETPDSSAQSPDSANAPSGSDTVGMN
jgi:Flp pilus assembly pilin Flp